MKLDAPRTSGRRIIDGSVLIIPRVIIVSNLFYRIRMASLDLQYTMILKALMKERWRPSTALRYITKIIKYSQKTFRCYTPRTMVVLLPRIGVSSLQHWHVQVVGVKNLRLCPDVVLKSPVEEDLLRLIRIALEKTVQILLFSLGAIKIQPTSPKSYKGKPMKNPWWMSAKKRRGEKSQVSLQEHTTALTLSISFAEYQLSSNPPDAAAPLDTLPPSLPDQAEDTNPGADISRPLAANAAGSKALGNVVASTDFTDSSFWNKHKRDPRAVIPRKRRAVLVESSVRP